MHAQVPNERVKTPTVLQMEASECGAASLGIVLGYYRYFVPLEELRLACDVTRDGSKASNILKAARQYGLIAKGLRQELSNLPHLKLPLIVHWNFNHFLVVEGFKGDKVYLNDPVIGPRVVTRAEFDQAFTGVVLTFAPGPEFRPGGNKHSLVKALRQRLRGSETALGYIVFAGLALVVPGLIIPAFTHVFVDDILAKGLNGWVKPLLLGMGLVLLLNAALTWLREHYLLRLQTKLAMSTSSRFLWHVLRLPIQFFMQRYAGEIGGRVALNDEVARLLSGELAVRAISLMTVVFFALVMFQYDVGLTLIGILIVALNMIALYYFSGKRRDEQPPLLQERGKLVGTAMSGLRTIESIKASGTEADFFTRWAGYQAKTLNAKGSLSIYTRLLINIPAFLAGVNTAAILGLGGLRVMTGQLSIGELVAFQALMASFVAPFTGLVNLSSQFQKVTGALNRLDDVLHHDLDAQFAQDNPGAEVDSSRLKLMGYLEIKNLSFGYSRLVPALIEDFSLSLKPGSRVALVGDTGSGKSTIARVVAGLYVPWSGQILFDGQPRADLPRSLINNSLALVDQDIFLFEGTVRENITLWDPLIPETDIIRAAKDAHIHDVIAARPGGYDSLIMEGGRNFSGGQRQRLEIARALALNPTLLILDEATSALDPTTEKIIDENIRRRGCSCLIIAHRLSTIRDCDEIIVLQQGRMVERGTHEYMRWANGPYARLIQVGLTKEDGVQGQKAETLLADLAAKLKK